MRISDWSSDVCSSDLADRPCPARAEGPASGGLGMKRLILWVPLVVFLVFLVTVAVGLYAPSDRKIQSQILGKSVPALSPPPKLLDRPLLDSADYAMRAPRNVNFSACRRVPCIAATPHLEALAERAPPTHPFTIRTPHQAGPVILSTR